MNYSWRRKCYTTHNINFNNFCNRGYKYPMKKKKLESILRAGYPTLLLSEEGEVRFPNALTSEGVVSPLQIRNFEKNNYIYLLMLFYGCWTHYLPRRTCQDKPLQRRVVKCIHVMSHASLLCQQYAT